MFQDLNDLEGARRKQGLGRLTDVVSKLCKMDWNGSGSILYASTKAVVQNYQRS